MTDFSTSPDSASEKTVNELAAWLLALEDASMYEPVPASLVEHGRRYVHAGLTEKHSGDCTKECHTCVVCSTSDAIAKAKQILEALCSFRVAQTGQQPIAWMSKPGGACTSEKSIADIWHTHYGIELVPLYAALADTSTLRPEPKPERSPWPAKGDRMMFLGRNGYEFELKEALNRFAIGKEYIVEDCNVQSWSHSVKFDGMEGWYNGVMFGRVADYSPVDNSQ